MSTLSTSKSSPHVHPSCLRVSPVCRRGLPGGRRHQAARSSDGCRTQTLSSLDPATSPPSVCPGNQTPRWPHTVYYSSVTRRLCDYQHTSSMLDNTRIMKGWSRFAPLKVFLTHRSNTRGHNERNCQDSELALAWKRDEKCSQFFMDVRVTTFYVVISILHFLPAVTRAHTKYEPHASAEWQVLYDWSSQSPARRWRSPAANGVQDTSKNATILTNQRAQNDSSLKTTPLWQASDQSTEPVRNLFIDHQYYLYKSYFSLLLLF